MVGAEASEASEAAGAVAAALSAAALGHLVLPVDLGGGTKKPHIMHWTEYACNWPDQIRSWWRKWPEAATGLLCGTRSGVYVVDIDSPDAVCGGGGISRATRRAGGRHVFYGRPESGALAPSAVRIRRGVDFRGEGGFVVAWQEPPAVGELHPLPEDLVPAPAPAPVRRAPWRGDVGFLGDVACSVLRKAAPGTRNATLFRMGCRLAEASAPEQVWQRLAQTALDVGLTADETRSTLRSAWGRKDT